MRYKTSNMSVIFRLLPFIVCIGLSSFSSLSFGFSGWHFMSSEEGQEGKNDNRNQKDPNLDFHNRFSGEFEDDITIDQKVKDGKNIKLTSEELHEALVWGISKEQEKRYLFLMKNRSGLYFKNKNLTPVEILGMNARNDQERQHYAEQVAEQESQRLAKILAFSSAERRAALSLSEKYKMPVVRSFNMGKYSPYSYEPINFKDHDSLLLFVHLDDAVRHIISSLMTSIAKNETLRLNIYFIGKKITKQKIMDWGNAQSIPVDWVDHRRITLNIGNERYAKLKDKPKSPALFLLRKGKSYAINTGRF